jgi:hypothetical protein
VIVEQDYVIVSKDKSVLEKIEMIVKELRSTQEEE